MTEKINGGRRPGAGRKKGYRAPQTLARQAAREQVIQEAGLTAARVLEEYRRLAFMDLRSFFDADGNLKPIQQLSAEQGSAMASVEVVIKNVAAGDGKTDTIHKFKLWDKTKALESLAKHFGLLIDRVEVTGSVNVDLLHAGRARAANAKKQA